MNREQVFDLIHEMGDSILAVLVWEAWVAYTQYVAPKSDAIALARYIRKIDYAYSGPIEPLMTLTDAMAAHSVTQPVGEEVGQLLQEVFDEYFSD